jgi:AraC-like DNA-binding protein
MMLARNIQADAASTERRKTSATATSIPTERSGARAVRNAQPRAAPFKQGFAVPLAEAQARVHDYKILGQVRYGKTFWPFVAPGSVNALHGPRDDTCFISLSAHMLDVWPGVAATSLNPPQLRTGIESENRYRAPARGGLPPRALRRVREYIDLHIEDSIGLKDLADVAGLSMFHFARAFKQSLDVTPNCYLFQRRVERAQKLLTESDLSLSEVAIAAGFSDQSHLTRRFREHVGTTPARFRWSRR